MPATEAFVKLYTIVMVTLVARHTVGGTDYSHKWKWAASRKTRYQQQQAKLRKRVDHQSLCRIATAAMICLMNTTVCRTACTWIQVKFSQANFSQIPLNPEKCKNYTATKITRYTVFFAHVESVYFMYQSKSL